MATALPVTSEKSKQINDLVTRQKIIKKTNSNRPTFPNQQREHLQYQKPAFTNFNNQLQRKKIVYPPSRSSSSNHVFGKTVQNTFMRQTDKKEDSRLNFDLSKLVNSLQIEEMSEVHNSSGCGRTRKPPITLDKIPDEVGITENNIPLTIRENLKYLIGRYDDGIWCAEVPKIYRLMFQKDLNYEEFGYMSPSDLCTSLPSIFHYSRPAQGDFKLYDKSKRLPPNVEKKFTVTSYAVGNTLSNEGPISAVPNIDCDDLANFLPENVFEPGHEIPREFLPPDTKEEDTIKIVVGETYDLSKFWVHLDNGLLDNLMDEMQKFYRANASTYLMPDYSIKEGIYCAYIIHEKYNRALIVDISPDLQDTIKEQILEVDLIDVTSPSNQFCLNTKLVERGFAQYPDQVVDTTPPVKESKRQRLLRLIAEKRKAKFSETECQSHLSVQMEPSRITGRRESCSEVLDESKSKSSSKSTNPFLSDLCEKQDDAKEPLVLNPNNPFLPYLFAEVKEQNPLTASDNSSTSTVYETLIADVKVEQKGVDNGNEKVEIERRCLSNDNYVKSLTESLSITNATTAEQASQATSMESHACAIHTSNEEPTPSSILHQVQPPLPNLPYGAYQPPQPYGGYTYWSTEADYASFGYRPRYPGSGYGYSDYMTPLQPWVMQMGPQDNSSMGPAYQQQPQCHPQALYQQQPPYQQLFQSRGPCDPLLCSFRHCLRQVRDLPQISSIHP